MQNENDESFRDARVTEFMKNHFIKAHSSGKHLRSRGVSLIFWSVCGLLNPLTLAATWAATVAQPAQSRYVPAASDVVLSTSVHAVDAGAASLRSLDQAWRRNPQDQAAALAYARAVFLIGLTEGDLRWYGSAKAALQPWWTAPALPADGYFLRGLVKQGFHDFAGGLADITQAIALDEARPEFWSWRFALHLLVSDMDAARQDCASLGRLFGADELAVCQAILQYRSGQAGPAAARFKELVGLSGFAGPLAQDWLRLHWGEALRTAGQYDEAIRVWQAHLLKRPGAHPIRLALAELLNAQGRAADAKRVASQPNPSDALLVQNLLASRALNDPDTERLAAQVAARFDSQALRNEALIERPQMVFLIQYGRDTQAGLSMALANWRDQQEPADAVLLLQAALLTNQPKAGASVIEWMRKTGYTEPALVALVQRIQSHPQWQGGGK